MSEELRQPVRPARLGRGTGWIFGGAALLLLGLFVAVAAGAAGDSGSSALGGFVAVFAGGMIAVGFWTRLFSAVEARLIDIEAELKRPK